MGDRVLTVGALFLAIFLQAGEGSADTLEQRIAPPDGYCRIETAPGGFGEWLRRLPLLPGRPPVLLFDGRQKAKDVHHAVVDLDVGTRNLQQCADAVIRLRAEYLRSAGCEDRIVFDFTSGDAAAWTDWQKGLRPEIRGNAVTWRPGAPPDASPASFRRYLDTVFTYAGTASLIRELEKVADPSRVEIGDVVIRGGFPGHAVLVADVAENARGERIFLLLQSYMPAQQIHVLKGPDEAQRPWYPARSSGPLKTPEWRFEYGDLYRFAGVVDCPAPRPVP